MIRACEIGNIPIVKRLLTRDDVDIAASSDDGWIPLLTACDQLHESLEIVNLLLAKDGINVNLYNKQRETRPELSRVVESLLARNDLNPDIVSSSDHALIRSGSVSREYHRKAPFGSS
jgi:ankyrin repeat protein